MLKKQFIILISIIYILQIISIFLFHPTNDQLEYYTYEYIVTQRSYIAAVILAILSYAILRYVISYLFNSKSDLIPDIVPHSVITVILPLIITTIVLFNFNDYFSIAIMCLLLYALFIFLIASFFVNGKVPDKLIAVCKTLVLIPCIVSAFLFSGQRIVIIGNPGHGRVGYDLFEFFDSYNFRKISVLNSSLNKEYYPPSTEIVYRDERKGDSVTVGSYANNFLFRDYYLTKDISFKVLRGFGFAFNFPEDEKYLLNK